MSQGGGKRYNGIQIGMLDLIEKFKQKLSHYAPEEQEQIIQAALWSQELHGTQKRASGEPYFIHPLYVAEMLVDMRMDPDTVIAGLLHDILEDSGVTQEIIKERFGETVASLVDGVTKISILKVKNKSVQEAETIRKMLFAMAKDIRVIIIKLADKLHNMNTLQHLSPERRKAIASECLDIYAPLADRMGISWMKAELEDLALKHLNPDIYKYIKDFLLAKKSERTEYLKRVEKAIYRSAAEEGIADILVTSRAKHFYSIYRKMKKRNKDIEEIYDILGVRITCSTSNDCYTLLGLIHKLWPPIEGRFKDYIAMPKANQYQSLHTTVMCYNGRQLEIQIRTRAMHYTAEFGIAAHWAYKQEFGGAKISADTLPIISKLKSWDQEVDLSDDFLDEIKSELLKDSIYVFTPEGHIIELPANSTAIDFAYYIHSEVGSHMIGAKADGSIIPLNQPLKNTQVVEILTSPNGRPHVNWLRIARTSRARQRIRNWLNKHDENLLIDKSIIAKRKAVEKSQEPQKHEAPIEPIESDEIIKHVIHADKLSFRIGNEKNMMISIAKCCSPSTGDNIIGYISRGRGIIVHKKSCPNLVNIRDIEHRTIDVEWESAKPRSTKRFKVTSRRTTDLFSEIEGAVKKYKGHLIEGRLEETEDGRLSGSFTMEIEQPDDFKRVIKSLRTIPSVISILPM